MSRFAIVITMPLALATLLAGQAPAQVPRIRVATRLVQVGVIVRDKNGPVANLTKNDFTVLDRGKPRAIDFFSAASGPPVAGAEESESPKFLQPPSPGAFSDVPQYSGAGQPRSLTLVLLDNLNTLYGSAPESQYEATPYWVEDLALQNAKIHLAEFIKQLQPQDRVAIYGLRHSLHVLCDFTCNSDQLLAILKNYDTRSITSRAVVEPGRKEAPATAREADGFENGAAMRVAGGANERRDAETMSALEQIAAHMANIPGRKNLVWLTANLPFSGAAMARVLSPANIAVYPIDARGLLARSVANELIPGTADADDLSGASGHMDNMPAQSSEPAGIATMRMLADQTGGQAFVNTNDLTGAIRKAVEDSAVTYMLGFYISSGDLDGKFHDIRVEVKAGGLTVRYPRGYFATTDAEATKDEDQARLAAAAQSPIEFSMIPLQATLQRVDQSHPNVFQLVCRIDPGDIRFARGGNLRKGAMTVYVVGQNAAGQALHNWSRTYNLEFSDTQYSELLKNGLVFHQGIQLHPGVTILRVIVQDPSSSAIGSLIIPLAQVN